MIECKICNFNSELSLVSHITRKHKITISEYREQFPNSIVQIISKRQRHSISNTLKDYYSEENNRKNMSLRMKNGGSWRCKEYWLKRGYTEQEALDEISKKQRETALKRTYLPEESIFKKEYWMKRHHLSEDIAIQKISEFQKIQNKKSKKFLGKKRDNEQKKKISISMSKMIQKVGKENWVSHFGDFKKSFRSKGEIELFEYVKNNIDETAECNVFVNGYNVDIRYGKNIIEYFGDYWHCNPDKYDAEYYHQIKKKSAKEIWEYDKEKIKSLRNSGFNVKIIWENDEWII